MNAWLSSLNLDSGLSLFIFPLKLIASALFEEEINFLREVYRRIETLRAISQIGRHKELSFYICQISLSFLQLVRRRPRFPRGRELPERARSNQRTVV